MSDEENAYLVVNLFVEDLQECRDFYEQVLNAPVIFEDSVSVAFRFHGVILYLVHIDEATRHLALCPPPGAPSPRMVLSLVVEDVNRVFAETTERGLVVSSDPANRPWGMRSFYFADPAGHCWEVAQTIDLLASAC